jgi:hypothetical protein
VAFFDHKSITANYFASCYNEHETHKEKHYFYTSILYDGSEMIYEFRHCGALRGAVPAFPNQRPQGIWDGNAATASIGRIGRFGQSEPGILYFAVLAWLKKVDDCPMIL